MVNGTNKGIPEKGDVMEKEPIKFQGLILEKQEGGIVERRESDLTDFFDSYGAKLAVTDKNGNPYGDADALLIKKNPNGLIVIKDEDRKSIDIMSEAIQKAIEQGFESIAISADTIEEINEVLEEIKTILENNQTINKIGFFFPQDQ